MATIGCRIYMEFNIAPVCQDNLRYDRTALKWTGPGQWTGHLLYKIKIIRHKNYMDDVHFNLKEEWDEILDPLGDEEIETKQRTTSLSYPGLSPSAGEIYI